MDDHKPPPSLVKLRAIERVKREKYGEWQILKQESEAFEKWVTDELSEQKFTHIRVFVVGSPRHCQVVTRAEHSGRKFYCRFRRDIRDGSHHEWIKQFNATPWQAENHTIQEIA